MDKNAKIYVAGHAGLVGSALVRELTARGYSNLVLKTHAELDLCAQARVEDFFAAERPDHVFLAAAKVGGIYANKTFPADFARINLLIQTNVLDAAFRHGAKKFLFLGSSCMYPRLAPQPMRVPDLMTGPVEPTNEWYALAKLAGWKMAQGYRLQHGFSTIAAIPANLYGPGDNFNPQDSHVVPALLRRFHEAKERGDATVGAWGTGSALREFLYVDDAAAALVFLMEHYDDLEIINVGAGRETSIRELTEAVAKVVGFTGRIEWDASKPDGMPRKLLDGAAMEALGFKARTSLEDGLARTYQWFLENQESLRR
jgi:GDP-L-fucose synthase